MDLDTLLPAPLARLRVGVSRQLFHYWCRTGALQPAATTTDGRPLYRHRDILTVERDMRASLHSSRRISVTCR